MIYDIFNPQVSVVSHDIGGKTILVYGTNGVGKTLNACRLPKPFYFPFERGINAIAGIPFLPIGSWSDFVKINLSLTKPANLEKSQAMYQTLIFDTVEIAYAKCVDYICGQYGVSRIKDGK